MATLPQVWGPSCGAHLSIYQLPPTRMPISLRSHSFCTIWFNGHPLPLLGQLLGPGLGRLTIANQLICCVG